MEEIITKDSSRGHYGGNYNKRFKQGHYGGNYNKRFKQGHYGGNYNNRKFRNKRIFRVTMEEYEIFLMR